MNARAKIPKGPLPAPPTGSPDMHVSEIAAKAQKRAGRLKAFVSRDANILLRAYFVSVKPLLEFNSVIWSPHTVKDITAIESVHRRFTKLCVLLSSRM